MRARSARWWIAGLAVALVLAVAGAALLAWQLRERYVNQLIQQVWPPDSTGPRVTTAEGGQAAPTLLLLGDSRMAQWDFPPPQAGRVVNAGLSGATTARITANARDLLEQYRPDIVVIEAGINDLKLAGARPDLRPKIVDTAASNLDRLVELALGFRAKVIVLLVWPASQPTLLRRPVWNSAEVSRAVVELNDRLRQRNAPDQGVMVVDLLEELNEPPSYRDTLHLQKRSYDRLTPRLLEKVERWRASAKIVP